MSDPQSLIRAVDLQKFYGKHAHRFHALKGVTIDIKRGESVAIVGKSGSGKTTLMHILALLDSFDQGELQLDGKNVAQLSTRQIEKMRNSTFGFVFQQFFLIPNQSVLENAILPLKVAGVGTKERRRRGMEVLEQLEMADKAKNKAVDLSGGQKQRLAIARALVNNPKVIFADEPTGNLDSRTGERVEEILFGLNKEQGITLVVVTHDHEFSEKFGRQIRVSDGLILSDSAEVAA